MATEANFRVVMTGHGRGEVFVNGVQMPGVTAVTLRVGHDQLNVVTLEMCIPAIEFDGPVSLESPLGRDDG